MTGFPVGMIALLIVTILVYFGLAHRVLDRMRLTDKAALIILASIIIGSFINIPLSRGRVDASINVGGGIVPVVLAIYVLSRAGTSKEWIRALGATVATALAVFFINTYLMSEDPWQTGTDFIDPLYVYPLVAGLVAYLVGRSRRSAFIAAILGVLSLDVVDFIRLQAGGTPGAVNIGGAGAFDTIILSGIVAVLLTEIIGETRERLQGGPESEGRPEELIRGLDGVKMSNRGAAPALKRDLRDNAQKEKKEEGDGKNE
ncbi:DUF1614 domain-containing protein [Zhaonella formicivorans]|uniref:DUF1614 domain-containing protein n=1 Tax=Zhaonella formicivorans TaxID=2528593 RepID=UPI0010F008EF|nr:DUF1614 domain-containing protein [Zhaonella formicivorans]